MKVQISTEELMGLLSETANVEEIKTKLTGELLSLVVSPEMHVTMEAAIRERVNHALTEALYVQNHGYYGDKTLEGWAAKALRDRLIKELQNVNVESIVAAEVKRAVDERVAQLVHVEVAKVFSEKWAEKALEYLNGKDLNKLIDTAVKARIGGLLGA